MATGWRGARYARWRWTRAPKGGLPAELGRVEVRDEAWWSMAFEASGDPVGLEEVLEGVLRGVFSESATAQAFPDRVVLLLPGVPSALDCLCSHVFDRLTARRTG